MISKKVSEIARSYSAKTRLSFGCEVLDSVTGRLSETGITEISGEAGTGKTQISLSLCIQCALRGIYQKSNDMAAYINAGEGSFPLKRFIQLVDNFASNEDEKQEILKAVQIETTYTIDDLIESINKTVPKMCQDNKNIKLVIIDSIAGLIRLEYDVMNNNKEMTERTLRLFKLSSILKWLSDTYKISIVIINQATATGFEEHSSNIPRLNNSTSTCPALGLAWSHCMNTRIFLERNTSHIRSVDQTSLIPLVNVDNHSIVLKFGTDNIENTGNIKRKYESYNCSSSSSFQVGNGDNKENQYDINSNIVTNKIYPYSDTIHNYSKQCIKDDNNDNNNNHNNNKTNKQQLNMNRSIRKLTVTFSPNRPCISCYYEITSNGVYGIS